MLMTAMQIATILTWALIVLWMLKYSIQHMASMKISSHHLLGNFKQKIWMTIGLGCFFSSLYIALVYLGSKIDLSEAAQKKLFFAIYQNPVDFVYIGLVLFVCISILICVVREIIKYLYHIFDRKK